MLDNTPNNVPPRKSVGECTPTYKRENVTLRYHIIPPITASENGNYAVVVYDGICRDTTSCNKRVVSSANCVILNSVLLTRLTLH